MKNKVLFVLSSSILLVLFTCIFSVGLKKNYSKKVKNNKYLASSKTTLINKLYPVGSIYMSTTDDEVEDVEERFGGTWEKIEGRFLLGDSADYTAGDTGGSANAVNVSHNHTFTGSSSTTSSNGAHTHTTSTFKRNWYVTITNSNTGVGCNVNSATESLTSSSAGAHTHTVTVAGTIGSSGVDGTGKNIPPYYAVYIYKRTA